MPPPKEKIRPKNTAAKLRLTCWRWPALGCNRRSKCGVSALTCAGACVYRPS